MSTKRNASSARALFAAVLALVLAFGVVACGGGNDNNGGGGGGGGGGSIKSNPKNGNVSLTVGSKNFTEEYILGEIYAQALEAAGYNVKTQLNLGDSNIALKALKDGQIDGWPDYTAPILEQFFGVEVQNIPASPQAAFQLAKANFEKQGMTAFQPTPFADANAVGTLKTTADKLGLKTVSDLNGKSQDLTLYGSPECRQRIDCLLGLERVYGLQFKQFTPVDIGLRYDVLDKGQADLSILFTSDAQLAVSGDKYVLLDDDKKIFKAGNLIFITTQDAVKKAGPDYEKTIEQVQQGLTLRVMQELNSRVDIDKQKPADVAHQYLKESGYIG
jgi:glycine betaine/choline ABC-type transport system substrate-binding protein